MQGRSFRSICTPSRKMWHPFKLNKDGEFSLINYIVGMHPKTLLLQYILLAAVIHWETLNTKYERKV
jgi:hypothetical protein